MKPCFYIGSIPIYSRVFSAPMAGISDLPFRQLCHEFGAGLTYSEMVLANRQFWDDDSSLKKQKKLVDKTSINAVQIVGNDPVTMSETAVFCQKMGADIIDINMGCPAKKINKRMAGAALLQNSDLVKSILTNVCSAVTVPVTLKIRTGQDYKNRNYLHIANIAEKSGIKALTIHGRTKEDKFNGQAEYDSIKEIKKQIGIPVIANGDINSPQKAHSVLDFTGADAVMIGRYTLGRPWVFNEINHFLSTHELMPEKNIEFISAIALKHIKQIHCFYGELFGVKIARKHFYWYWQDFEIDTEFRRFFGKIEKADKQISTIKTFINQLKR